MNVSLLQAVIFLLAGIAVIVVLTARYRIHAFFALLLACLVTGLGVGLSIGDLLNAVKEGFGNIMRSLALILVMGTTLGMVLEYTGSTRVMANFIMKLVGPKNAAWAISITGFIVGLPVFCDSGYIVLSGLNKSLSRKTATSIVVMSVSLATGLYAVHCLIPPHPGAAAAAVTIGVDIGKLIVYGIIIAIPAMIVGHWWSVRAGKKAPITTDEEEPIIIDEAGSPSVISSFLPVLIPILLIALRSSFTLEPSVINKWPYVLLSLGDPVIALSIGVLLAFATKKGWNKKSVSLLLQESAEKAGGILVIIGAGGAFGAVLALTKMGDHFSEVVAINAMGLLFPFLLTFILKTAQGSSTVAIITAASIVLPLLPSLHLTTETDKILAVLAMGAGSMMISHANDAYFWVITKFSGLDIKTTFKVYTVASVLMGITSILMIYILSWIVS